MSTCDLCRAPIGEPGYGNTETCPGCGQEYYGEGDGWPVISLDNNQLNLLRRAKGLPELPAETK